MTSPSPAPLNVASLDPYEEARDPRRHALIQRLDCCVDGQFVNKAMWAFAWLADLDRLEEFTRECEQLKPRHAYLIMQDPYFLETLKLCGSKFPAYLVLELTSLLLLSRGFQGSLRPG